MTKLKVCILPEKALFDGRGSSAETHFLGLARALLSAGHAVDCLDPWSPLRSAAERDALKLRFRDIGIHLVQPDVPPARAANSPHGRLAAAPYLAYEVLKAEAYDVIHATDRDGVALYYLQAKRLGLLRSPAQVWVHVASPYLYELEIGQVRIESYSDPMLCYLERRCVELADEIVVRSRTILDWMKRSGYERDWERVRMDPGLSLPVPAGTVARDRELPVPVRRLVFAGRMNHVKGLTTACYMLRDLAERDVALSSVLFVGPDDPQFDADTFLGEQAATWPYAWKRAGAMDRSDLLVELSKPDTLVVFPADADERPYLLQECIALGIPFFASAVGDIADLLGGTDSELLLPPHYLSFADAVSVARKAGARRPSATLDIAANIATWVGWHSDIVVAEALSGNGTRFRPPWKILSGKPAPHAQAAGPGQGDDAAPLVSVCIAHYNRPDILEHTLASIEAQTFGDFEIILVDDGSSQPRRHALEALLERFPRVRPVFQRNLYLGATRNTGARSARGKYLLFMDDDNCALPHEIELFVSIAERRDVDILVCFSDNFTGDGPATPDTLNGIRRLPLGPDLVYGMMRNGYGDSNCFMRRDVWEALGGFTEHYRVGLDDHEFFTRATLAGYDVDIVPEALYHYRLAEKKMKRFHASKRANVARVAAPYIAAGVLPPDMLPLMYAMRGFYERLEENGMMRASVPKPREEESGEEKPASGERSK